MPNAHILKWTETPKTPEKKKEEISRVTLQYICQNIVHLFQPKHNRANKYCHDIWPRIVMNKYSAVLLT